MNNNNVNLPIDLLEKILSTLCDHANIIEGEWGTGRSIQKLIENSEMPDCYYTLIALKSSVVPPKTLIFKSYEDFLEREDQSVNGVSEQFAEKNPNYEKDNSTNIGCYDCINCNVCYHCNNCNNCYNCYYCYNCSYLTGITNYKMNVPNI